MKRANRIFVTAGCLALLAVSWLAALTAKSDAQKQAELLDQAAAYTADQIYVRAVPLLEEAAGYQEQHTDEAEEALKAVYLQLLETSGYRRKYTDLLDRQMARDAAQAAVFEEAARYYLELGRLANALEVLRSGIAKTGDESLTALYEASRYAYRLGRESYEDATALLNGGIQVRSGGLWGLAGRSGALILPCAYDRISSWGGTAVVEKDGEIYAVDADNNRVALLREDALEFGNLNENRIPFRLADGWHRANAELKVADEALEYLGTYSEGCAAAKQNGKWGLLDAGGAWVIEPSYDGVFRDELDRCYGQGAVFMEKDGQAVLVADGEEIAFFEEARPFADGWAAVKRDGKWGFVDTSGTIRIDFQFDEACSFGMHLAAVKMGRSWGYAGLSGQLAIPAEFAEARSFSGGSAPVRVDGGGWQLITLLEYEE